MKNLILILLAGAVSYGGYYHYNRPVEEPVIDDTLKEYVSEWKDIEYITAIYEYTDGDDRIGGINRLNKTIEVKANYAPEIIRCVVYHELGHYVLRLRHSEDGEIMSTAIRTYDPDYYGVNWPTLVDTYFDSYLK